MNAENLTPLERRVMEMLLAGGDAAFATLRTQLAACSVLSREMTGVGFFTTFKVPRASPKVANCKSFKFGDVTAKFPGLQRGAGFLLYIKSGTLELLEGYTYDEPWPQEIAEFEVVYDKGSRDWEALKAIAS